jgi:hypothetical protein
MLEVIGASSGQSWIVSRPHCRVPLPAILRRARMPVSCTRTSGLGVAMAAAAGGDTSLWPACAGELFAETLERGWGGEDDAVLLRTALAKIAERKPGLRSGRVGSASGRCWRQKGFRRDACVLTVNDQPGFAVLQGALQLHVARGQGLPGCPGILCLTG